VERLGENIKAYCVAGMGGGGILWKETDCKT
jgi:hypothetical protein